MDYYRDDDDEYEGEEPNNELTSSRDSEDSIIFEDIDTENEKDLTNLKHMDTPVKPRNSNHTYSGICFDVKSCGFETIIIRGVAVGGEIGNYTIWSKNTSVQVTYKKKSDYTLVAKGFSQPSFQKAKLLKLETPIFLKPNSVVTIYVHSGVRSDRGIYYQSISRNSAYCKDDNLEIYPGFARVGNPAFDSNDTDDFGYGNWGWGGWRSGRAFSGSIIYSIQGKKWSYNCHREFPLYFRDVVICLLLCWNREECPLSMIPAETLFHVIELLNWRDWEETNNKSLSKKPKKCLIM